MLIIYQISNNRWRKKKKKRQEGLYAYNTFLYASDQCNNTFTSELVAWSYGRNWFIEGNLYFITNITPYGLTRDVQIQFSKNKIKVSPTRFIVIPLLLGSYFKRQGTQTQTHINLPRELQITNLNSHPNALSGFRDYSIRTDRRGSVAIVLYV